MQRLRLRLMLSVSAVLVLAFSFSLSTNMVKAAPIRMIINEFYRGGNLTTTDEWVEILLVENLTAAQLNTFFIGDSTGATAAKFSGYQFTNMGTIAATFPAGTLIVVGGSTGVTQDTSYNPAANDWNIFLTTAGAFLTGNGSNGDLAGTDVVYVDTNGTNGNTTISDDGFAVNWDSTPGAFGANANVTIAVPSNNTGAVLSSDFTGATNAGNWTTSVALVSMTQGQPNGGANTTYINTLRAALAGGDVAPAVNAVTPADAATDVAVDATITIDFSEAVAVAVGAVNVTCSVSGSQSSTTTSASTTSFVFDPVTDFTIGETCDVTVSATGITDVDGDDPPDNMDADFLSSFTVVIPLSTTLISAVQGGSAGNPYSEDDFNNILDESPLHGQTVQVTGIVVGDFQETDEFSGFFMQEETGDEDGDPLTSEGIFVFCNAACSDVEVGNTVTVIGAVDEYFNQTQIDNDNSNLSVVVIDQLTSIDDVTPVLINFPFAAPATALDANPLEAFEGMLAYTEDVMIATEYFEYDRYTQLRVWSDGTGTGRPLNFTQTNAPDATGFTNADLEFQANSFFIDDGNADQNVAPKAFPAGFLAANSVNSANGFRGGDQVTNLIGIFNSARSRGTGGNANFRLHVYDYSESAPITTPTGFSVSGLPTFTNVNPRPTAPNVIADYTVASFNVLNYFNGDGLGGGFPTPRGASNASELTRQTDKLAQAICAIDADVIGLLEVENDYADGVNSAIQDIVDAANGICGTYDYINPGGNVGTDAITVAIIYKPARVSPTGTIRIVDENAFVDPNTTGTFRNRPAIIQSFATVDLGEIFTVAVNHLKSKGSGTGNAADNDQGDGQGASNDTRTKAAQYLVNLLDTDPTGVGDTDYLILGDLNSYAQEDPIVAIEASGYTNLVEAFGGEYGYVFDGRWGTLDYALASPTMTTQIVAAIEYHINADESDALDYDDNFNPSGWYEVNEYRTSDHDPVIVGINFNPIIVVDPVTGQPVTGGIDLDGDGVVDVVSLPATGETPFWRDNMLYAGLAALLLIIMSAGVTFRRRIS